MFQTRQLPNIWKIAVKGMFHMKLTRMDILRMELSDRVNSLRPGDAYMRH